MSTSDKTRQGKRKTAKPPSISPTQEASKRVEDVMAMGIVLLHTKHRLNDMVEKMCDIILNGNLTEKEKLARVSAVACVVARDTEKYVDERIGYYVEVLREEGYGPDDEPETANQDAAA